MAEAPFPTSDTLLAMTKDVNIELSNLCNYARVHRECPLHALESERRILPAAIVSKVLAFLGRRGYAQSLWFHTYNEPLIDPRLFLFLQEARQVCPEAKLSLCSNGYYLNQGLLDELVQAGLATLYLSAYSDAEYERLSRLTAPFPVIVTRIRLDNRLDIYDRPPVDIASPCLAPYGQIIVTAAGDLSLCCLDWKREHVFGNLALQSMEQILLSDAAQEAFTRLSRGERVFPVCRRCDWSR